jgi:hypothetical protein
MLRLYDVDVISYKRQRLITCVSVQIVYACVCVFAHPFFYFRGDVKSLMFVFPLLTNSAFFSFLRVLISTSTFDIMRNHSCCMRMHFFSCACILLFSRLHLLCAFCVATSARCVIFVRFACLDINDNVLQMMPMINYYAHGLFFLRKRFFFSRMHMFIEVYFSRSYGFVCLILRIRLFECVFVFFQYGYVLICPYTSELRNYLS